MKNKKTFPLDRDNIVKLERKLNSALESINDKIPIPQHFKYSKKKLLNNSESCSIIESVGDCWYLGYSNYSIKPYDISIKKYYIGGNISIPPRKVKRIIDDIKVRTICVSAGKDKEKIVLSCVDCIGITNVYVNRIRRELKDFCEKNNISSINIFSTHSHSSIDTMGVWSITFKKFLSNIIQLNDKNIPYPTVDIDYMDYLIEKVKASIMDSLADLKPGKMHVLKLGEDSSTCIKEKICKEIGFDKEKHVWNEVWQKKWESEFLKKDISEIGIFEYILAKRYPYEFLPCMTRIRFEPLDETKLQTIILNFSAHPYSNGLKVWSEWKGDGLSGDFPYYMEKVFNENNINFIFFNGAINGIYTKRGAAHSSNKINTTIGEQTETIGRDLAGIALAVNKTEDEILSNFSLNPVDRSDCYKSMIERELKMNVCETEVLPKIIECKKDIYIKCSNPIEKIFGKLNFAQFNAYRTDENELFLKSEIGYIQLGDFLRFVLIPGELTPELLTGIKENEYRISISNNEEHLTSINNIFGENTIVLGLANDAIGYIIPDNDYCMLHLGNGVLSKKILGQNYTHYQEMFSLGHCTASTILNQLMVMKEFLNKSL